MLISVFFCVAVISFSPAFSNSDNILRHKRAAQYVPCERGWYYFRDKCYKSGGWKASERLSWTGALDKCKSWGADLVSIHSQEEQDFITSFLHLEIKFSAWIGLNDRDTERDFKWTDGSAFNYSNWNLNEPNGLEHEAEDCIHMLFETWNGIIGKWDDISCENAFGFVCKRNPNRRKRSPNEIYCSSDSNGGWKYESSCYHIVTEMKSWQNAEKHCKDDFNGHLVTISDMLEDVFLDYILANIKNDLWIGIKIQDQMQQKWTSGWYVSYDGFKKEELNFLEGTCAARKKRNEWIIIPCSKQLSFICETSTVSAPVLKLSVKGSHCPKQVDDWRDLGGDYCYYIETGKHLNFYEANFDCKRRGGDLVSLHSKEEADILIPFMRYKIWSVFIGLVRLFSNEETFAWTDGSPMNYENWDHNEPNNEQEKCAEALTINMKWNDISCEEKRGYVCSVKKTVQNSNDLDSAGCENFCIAMTSYLHGLISQCPEAKRLP